MRHACTVEGYDLKSIMLLAHIGKNSLVSSAIFTGEWSQLHLKKSLNFHDQVVHATATASFRCAELCHFQVNAMEEKCSGVKDNGPGEVPKGKMGH